MSATIPVVVRPVFDQPLPLRKFVAMPDPLRTNCKPLKVVVPENEAAVEYGVPEQTNMSNSPEATDRLKLKLVVKSVLGELMP